MKLTEQLTDYIHAACPGIWIQTLEADEAEREILQHARQKQWKVAVWDVANGLAWPAPPAPRHPTAEAVVRLRSWASGRCLSTSYPGIYQSHGSVGPRQGLVRKILSLFVKEIS